MTLIGSFNMKDYKNPKKTPDKIEESFAYDGGIGEPDKNWQRNMEIDEHPTKEKEEDDSEEKKIRPSLNSNQGHKNSKIEHIKGVKDITSKNLPVAGASFCFKMICFTGIYPPLDLHLRQAL